MPKMGEGHLSVVYVGDGAGHYIKAPVLTTAQRDALTGVKGMLIFNSTTDQFEEYDGSTWEAVGQVILDTHIADLDAHIRSPWQDLLIGSYYQTPWPSAYGNTQVLTANRLYAWPMWIPRAFTFDRIAIEITTGDSGKSIRLGYMTDTGGATPIIPSTLVTDLGVVSAASAAFVAITGLSESVTKGLYWILVVSDGTPTVRGLEKAYTPIGMYETYLNQPNSGYYVSYTYGALPSTWPGSETKTRDHLHITPVRIASLD